MFPVLFDFDFLTIYSYPFFMGLSWGLAFYYFDSIVLQLKLKKQLYYLFFFGVFLSSWLGAKALFLMTSAGNNWSPIAQNLNFWLGGGFVFLGGLFATLIFIILWNYLIFKLDPRVLKYGLVGLAFSHGVGRIGCFLAGCCFGSKTNSFFSVFIHQEHRHPVQLYEFLGLLLIGAILKKYYSIWPVGKFLRFYIYSYGALRFVLEFIRGDQIRGSLFQLSTSQTLIIFLVIITFFIELNWRRLTVLHRFNI